MAESSPPVKGAPATIAGITSTSVVGAPAAAEKPKAPATDLMILRHALQGRNAKQRMDLILDCPDVLRVVQRLPVQDLFATVKEVGVGDALELIELLHPRQVQGFIDLDAWRKDRLDPVALADWLEAIFAASPQRAVKQIVGLDVELLALLFKMHTQVYDLTLEEQPEQEPTYHSVTPDQRYLIVYDPEHEKLALTLMQTVDRLFGTDPGFVLRLIESVRWELPSALEEECYRWRNGRLADLGFVPLEEAGQIFAYVDPDQTASQSPTPSPTPAAVVDDDEAPQDLSSSVIVKEDLLKEGGHVLGLALSMTDDAHRRRVGHELVIVANRLHVAVGGDAGDTEALQQTVQRAADTIGIALSYLAKGEPRALQAPVESLPCLTLFQIGHSVTLRLGREFRAHLTRPASGLAHDGLLRLDHPLREVVAGVLRPQPLFFAGLNDARRNDFIPFRSLADVAAAARALGESVFRASLVGGRVLPADPLALAGVTDARIGPSHAALLATFMLRHLLTGTGSFFPLRADDVIAIHARFGAARQLAPDDRSAMQTYLAERVTASGLVPGARDLDDARTRAAAYLDRVLSAVEDELAALTPQRDLAPLSYLQSLFTEASLAHQPHLADAPDPTEAG